MIGMFLAALGGLVAGWLIGAAVVRRGEPVRQGMSDRRAEVDHRGDMLLPSVPPASAPTAEADLAELRQTWQKRRHDVRGALSPALLTADRLTSHEDDQVRRAGQIVVQSLQRAIDALADPVKGPPPA